MVSAAGIQNFVTIGQIGHFTVEIDGAVRTISGVAQEIGNDYIAISTSDQFHVFEFNSIRSFRIERIKDSIESLELQTTTELDGATDIVRTCVESTPPDQALPLTASTPILKTTSPPKTDPGPPQLNPTTPSTSIEVHVNQLSNDLPEPPPPVFGRHSAGWSDDQRDAFGHALNVWNYAVKVREHHRALFEVRPLWDAGLSTDDLRLLALAGQMAFWGGDLERSVDILKEVRYDGPIEALQTLVHAQYRLGRALDAAESCALLNHRLQVQHESGVPDHLRPWTDLSARWATDLGEDIFKTIEDTVTSAKYPNDTETAPHPATHHLSSPAVTDVRLLQHTGRVDRIWPREEYGFLAVGLPAGGRRTVFFEFTDVLDEPLLKAIQSGWTGTVSFVERVENTGTPHESRRATKISAISPLTTATTDTPPKSGRNARNVELHGQGRLASATARPNFQRAKRLELEGSLEAAAAAYRQVIDTRQAEWRSAVKDLAWLLNRMGSWQEALRTLDQYDEDSASRATLNLRMHILLKGKDYASARKVIQRLTDGADAKQLRGLLKQDVYCLVAMSHVQQAIRLLERGIEDHPDDLSLVQLHDRLIALSHETAQIDLASLEAVGSGITPFSRYYLETAAMVGADERSKARGYFDEKDFRLVMKAFEQIRGRRQSDRAQFMLTLAVMCWKDPLSAGNYQLSELLRRFFTLMAEAELAAGGSVDVVRAFAGEALALSQPQDVIFTIPAVIDTYSGATTGESQERLARQGATLMKSGAALNELREHLPYYQAKSGLFLTTLRSEWGQKHALFTTTGTEEAASQFDQRRLADLTLAGLEEFATTIDSLSIAKISEAQSTLHEWSNTAFFRLDKDRLRLLAKTLQSVERCLVEEDYSEQQNAYDRARMECGRLADDCIHQPTYLSVVGIRPYCTKLSKRLLEMQASSRSEARSSLDVKDAFENDRYKIEQDGTVRITLLLSVPTGAPPLEDVVVSVDESNGLKADGVGRVFPILPSGQRREVRLKVEPTRQQTDERAFTVSGRFTYHYNDISDERTFSIPVRLDDDLEFQPIPNPYEAYAGGTIVDDPAMFYGRREVLDRIVTQVSGGANGKCFVLYGQKRSGKSSVLAQVHRKLEDRALAVKVTMGEIDTVQADFSFLGVCLSEVYATLRERHMENIVGIPDQRPLTVTLEHFKGELRRIRRAFDDAGFSNLRVVLLVDEFTYVFGYIRRGMMNASFMRLWKALLESGLLNTVVVGQDSMPRFKQEFANEFGVTKDERLSYLRHDHAEDLATKPILLRGEPRFRGDSLARLIWYTGGSPWYMQIMCDRLVQKLNAEEAALVTEADIDDVALELVSGSERLGIEKFDPLITASADIEELFPRDTYLDVLRAIANGTSSIGILSSELYEDELSRPPSLPAIVDDLVARDVVRRRETGHLRITVGLFERWLRVNRPFVEM